MSYEAHFTDVSLADYPHLPEPRGCGHPRPALRVSVSTWSYGRRLSRLVGLSCQHLELGPLFDQMAAAAGDRYFDIDPIDLKGAEAKLLKKLIDDHRHYLPDDGCEFADRADYEAHHQGPGHTFRES